MKRILLALALLFVPSLAFAQCNGVFSAGQVCGSANGGVPGPAALGSIPIPMAGNITMYPNPANNPGSAPANQVAMTGFGVLINISSSTTGGLSEIENQAATIGWPIYISQFGITSSGTNPQFIGTSTTWTTHPRGIWSIDISNTTLNCTMADGTNCVVFDSAEIGRFNLTGQIVYGSTGDTIDIHPTTQTPNDHFIVFSLNDFAATTTVAISSSEAAIKIDPTATASLGVQQNVFNFKEVNNGAVGIKVLNPSATSGGHTPVFSHNIITATAIHGQATAGVQVGQSITNQAQMGGNVWTALFNSSAETDAFVTYEHNSLHIVGFDPTNTLTNGLHYKSGAINNVAIILDTAGATTPVVDDNVPGGGNIIIGRGNITVGGFNIALQNSNVIFASVVAPNVYGGTIPTSTLTLSPTSTTPASGAIVQLAMTGDTTLYMGSVCNGQTNPTFVGFAAGNSGQADCTHYNFISNGGSAYFNAASGASVLFNIANNTAFQVFSTRGLNVGAGVPTVTLGELGFDKITASGTAPGAGSAKIEAVAGTNAGTCKLIAYAGTSTTPVTIVDNIGVGC